MKKNKPIRLIIVRNLWENSTVLASVYPWRDNVILNGFCSLTRMFPGIRSQIPPISIRSQVIQKYIETIKKLSRHKFKKFDFLIPRTFNIDMLWLFIFFIVQE